MICLIINKINNSVTKDKDAGGNLGAGDGIRVGIDIIIRKDHILLVPAVVSVKVKIKLNVKRNVLKRIKILKMLR